MLLGKHQLNELGSESAKIKAMNITSRVLSSLFSAINHSIKNWTFINVWLCFKTTDGFVVDFFRQAGEVAEHFGKEYPRWV